MAGRQRRVYAQPLAFSTCSKYSLLTRENLVDVLEAPEIWSGMERMRGKEGNGNFENIIIKLLLWLEAPKHQKV